MQSPEEPSLNTWFENVYLHCSDCFRTAKTQFSICAALFPYLLFVGFLSIFISTSQKRKLKS